jgi:hypothetical protein
MESRDPCRSEVARHLAGDEELEACAFVHANRPLFAALAVIMGAVLGPLFLIVVVFGWPETLLATASWFALGLVALWAVLRGLSTYYLIGLTTSRLVVLQVSGWPRVKWHQASEVGSFRRGAIVPVKVVSSRWAHDVRLGPSPKPIKFTLRRLGVGVQHSEAIAAALMAGADDDHNPGTQPNRALHPTAAQLTHRGRG